jgi:hypothetical protein
MSFLEQSRKAWSDCPQKEHVRLLQTDGGPSSKSTEGWRLSQAYEVAFEMMGLSDGLGH